MRRNSEPMNDFNDKTETRHANHHRKLTTTAFVVALAFVARTASAEGEKLRVLATTTDLRELAKEVGGDDVVVTCLTKGPEDPHFIDARPSL